MTSEEKTATENPIAHLPKDKQIALTVLANGGRYREAAKAANVKPSTVYKWLRENRKTYKQLCEVRYLPLADLEIDVLQLAMNRAMDPTANAKEVSNALKASAMVQKGLGIGTWDKEERKTHDAPQVIVNVDLSGVLQTTPKIRVDTPDPLTIDIVPVEE